MIWNILTDIRYSARALLLRPGFVGVVVLTLALGIGANVAIFSIFQQILLHPLPVAEPDRLVNLSSPGPSPGARLMTGSDAGGFDAIFSYPMFRDLERAQEPFVGIAAHRIFDASLSTGEQARPDTGVFVSGSYFSVLGLEPALGRLLGPDDDRVDGLAESVVLSHAYWQNALDGDPAVLGRRLIVNGTPLTIVGVAPLGFHGTTVGARASVFVPITFRGGGAPIPNHDSRLVYWVNLFARLEPGVTRVEATAAIDPLYRAILNEIEAPLVPAAGADEQALEAFRARSLVLEPGARGQSRYLEPARNGLGMLLAVSGLVLLLCCANVAGLMLVRGAARSGEMAVRASMGATRRRLASLLVAESLLLALPAAIASVPVATLSMPVALLTLRRVASEVPGISTAEFDASLSLIAAFVAIGVAVVSALVSGLFPLRGLMHTEPGRTLQASGVRQTSRKGVTRFRTALATTQIALSMALLAVTFVFAQSLANIARIDLGLDVDSVVTFSISPQTSGYTPEASARLFDRLEEELVAVPGVSSAASAWTALLTGGDSGTSLVIEGEVQRVPFNVVSPDFFRTLGIELLAGRDFRDADAAGAPEVVIVNQRFAERFLLGRAVIGRRIGRDASIEIVGLVADAKYGNVTGELEPTLFRPRRQWTAGSMSFYVRGERPSTDLMNAVRDAVARIDAIVPLTDLHTMEQRVRENLATERFVAGASTAFAVLATALAALGLYGVLAYSVAQRSREIGLRFALGAPVGRIRGMLLRQVVGIVVIGVVLGVIAAWLLSRAARSLLFGVEAGDPLALALAAGVLVAVTLGAAYIPARRASRVDPMVVLRYE